MTIVIYDYPKRMSYKVYTPYLLLGSYNELG